MNNINEISNRLVGKFLIGAVVVGVMMVVAADSAGGPTDKMTSLPLHAGLTFQQEVDSPVVEKKPQMDLYDTPQSAMMSEYLAWY
jgi:hypothetical protein